MKRRSAILTFSRTYFFPSEREDADPGDSSKKDMDEVEENFFLSLELQSRKGTGNLPSALTVALLSGSFSLSPLRGPGQVQIWEFFPNPKRPLDLSLSVNL
jgi:hypothetical protein